MTEQNTETKSTRAMRKRRVGIVVSDKMDKTVVVVVADSIRHPLYQKIVRRTRKFHAHDENNDAKLGDRVEIVETRPISKLKHWRVTEVIERAR